MQKYKQYKQYGILNKEFYIVGMLKKYISDKGEQGIKSFKYKGGSAAYSYDYLWSPLAQFLLDRFIPLTWAPNAITLSGLLFSIAGCMAVVGQGLGNHLAAPSLLVLAVFNFIYYTLDNMDGKQARRTGTSSPLGMLMDHGCDAFGMSFIVLAVCSIIMLKDPATILYTAQAGVMFTFWASVWAQYHSNGIMILGKVNAVDDGIPLISLLAVISWFCGQDWWVSPFFEGITLQWVLVRGIQFSSVVQIFSLVRNAGQNFTKDYLHAFSHLLHIGMIGCSLWVIITYTNWHENYFFSMYFCMAFTMIRDISYLHLCVVSGETYQQFQSTTIVYTFAFPSTFLPYQVYIFCREYFTVDLVPQPVFVYGMLGFFLWKYFHFIACAFVQIAQILNLSIFTIKPKVA